MENVFILAICSLYLPSRIANEFAHSLRQIINENVSIILPFDIEAHTTPYQQVPHSLKNYETEKIYNATNPRQRQRKQRMNKNEVNEQTERRRRNEHNKKTWQL